MNSKSVTVDMGGGEEVTVSRGMDGEIVVSDDTLSGSMIQYLGEMLERFGG